MKENKLKKIEQNIRSLRNRSGNLRASELEAIAKRLGRERSKRGKEPTYVSLDFPDLRPVSIPSHSTGLKRFTAESILDQLDEDVFRWREELDNTSNTINTDE